MASNGIQGNSKMLHLYEINTMQPIFIKVYSIEMNYYVNSAQIALLVERNMESVMEDIEDLKWNAMNLLREDQSEEG